MRMRLTCDNGYYWLEVHIPWSALLEEEAVYIIDYRLVVDNHSLDYNPEENLKIIIRRICGNIDNN